MANSIIKSRLTLFVLQAVLIGAAIVLAVFSLRRSDATLSVSEINLLLIAGAAILYGLFYVFMAINWAYVVHIVEHRPIHWSQMWAYFASQPYKYLPTSAFSISARSIYAKKIGGLKLSATAKAQLIENGAIFASGLIIIALVKTNLSLAVLIPLVLLIFVSLFSVSFSPYRELRRAYKYVTLVFITAVAWLVGGLSLFTTLHSLGAAISFEDAIYLHAATILASIAAVLVPAGIGIREAILFSQNIGLPGVLLWRALSVVVDLATGIAAIFKINRN